MNPDKSLEGPTIKAALLLGFGLTLGLWLFAGYQFTQRMVELQEDAARTNARYMHAQELLSTVRARVLLGSVYLRDALLDPDRRSIDEYRLRIENTYQAIDASLRQYTPVLDSPSADERLAGLRSVLRQYRATLLEVLSGDSSRWPGDARTLLATRVVPSREEVIRVSEEVQALNRVAFVQLQNEIADIYAATQRRVWQQLGLALLASFAIGLVATRYAGRLERRIRDQMEAAAGTARDLQRLSSQLIKVQEDERRAIARELHDEVGQVLTAMKLELAMADRAIVAAGAPANVLSPARSIADGALQTIRDLSRLLHPTILDDLGLPAAIELYLKEFGTRNGLAVTFTHEGMGDRLAAEVEAAAYRIVQEAITNVVKHARAQNCGIQLQRLPNTLLVTVEDDGVGFDTQEAGRQAAPEGLGLIGIRERVGHLRGTLRIESAPGRGTRLTAVLAAPPRPAEGKG